ncbi:MAG: hypothetical protein LUF85_10770 [Bacteroides sp.]|nr:hypothetical protein [Bacteroides sp.]
MDFSRKRKQTPGTGVETHSHIAPVTTAEEVLHLCCNIVRKKELYLRAQAQRLHPATLQKIIEPGEPNGYKGLRIETREYTLWCELRVPEGNSEKQQQSAYCKTVLLYFYDSDKLKAFLKVLREQRRFHCVWDHQWLDLEENHIKIILKMAQTPRIPHCLIFTIRNHKL